MGFNYTIYGYGQLAEIDEDVSIEEMSLEKDPSLGLVDNTSQTEDSLFSSVPFTYRQKGNLQELSEEDSTAIHVDTESDAHSSLHFYCKAVSRFPLLDEEEERTLAKLIKVREHECKHLVIQWDHLLKKWLLEKFFIRSSKSVIEEIHLLDRSFQLFDNLITWEKRREHINRELEKRDLRSNSKRVLHKELYEVEAEISKYIAVISLNGTKINRIIRNLKKLSHGKRFTKKQQGVEKELGRILKKIGHSAKKVKLLKNELVQANLRLVIVVAKQYAQDRLSLSDLIQEGNLGLIRAVDTFDYRRGHRFITYAHWWVRQAILRALYCQSRTIRTPVYLREKLNKIINASHQLLQEWKREPTLEEIAQETNTPLRSIEKVLQSFKNSISLDSLIEEKGDSVIGQTAHHEILSDLDRVILSNLSHILNKMLSDLNLREREIIKLRFGIEKKHEHTLEEIGEKSNLSRERIRQILEEGLSKLSSSTSRVKLKDFI